MTAWNIPDNKLNTVEELKERLDCIFRQREKLDDSPSAKVSVLGKESCRDKKYRRLYEREEALLNRLRDMRDGRSAVKLQQKPRELNQQFAMLYWEREALKSN